MQLRIIVILCLLIVAQPNAPAYGFYRQGKLAEGITFGDLTYVYRGQHRIPWKIKGDIRNDTKKEVRVRATGYFTNVFGERTAEIRISKTIPAQSRRVFASYIYFIDGVDFSENILDWEVSSPSTESVDSRLPRPTFTESQPKNTITLRPFPCGARLNGQGRNVSKKFNLSSGINEVSFEHKGKESFKVELLNSDGVNVSWLANEYGPCEGAMTVKLKKAGQYALSIQADGFWRMEIENRQAAKQRADRARMARARTTSQEEHGASYRIHLKSGRIIRTDSCVTEDGRVHISAHGADISISMDDVETIQTFKPFP